MARPLLWSGGAHLLVLAACLLIGAGRGPADRLLPAVEVLLVGGETGFAGAERSGPGSAGPPRGVSRLAAPARGEEAPSPMPPATATRAERATRTAGSAPGPPEPSASVPADGIPARPAIPGLAVEAAPVFAGTARVQGWTGVAGATDGESGESTDGRAAREPGARERPGSGRAGAADVPASGGAPSGPAAVSDGAGPGPGGEPGLLRERIQSRIVYPEEAVRRGLEGEVRLRIHIETGGIPNEIRIARSSGVRLLDDAARRGVVSAVPLPSSPGWVEIPVRFRLR